MGIKIEKRELSWEERYKMFSPHVDGILTESWANEIGYPKVSITVTYNNKIIEIYE